MSTSPIETTRRIGTLSLHMVEAGPAQGPVVILLHGFPEFWFGWRRQISALADAGFRVVAPDQRGYGLSDKPSGVAAYDLDSLSADIVALGDALGASQFSLVGHDWGGAVAWWVAQHHPMRVRRLATLNAPHPGLWRRAMDHDREQRSLSFYVRLFGIPFLPELILKAGNYNALAGAMNDSLNPPTEEALATYRQAWSRRGALTGMLNWYRAILRRRFGAPLPRMRVPTQMIWGGRDKYSTLRLAEESKALCDRGNLTVFPNATHWVQHDEPDRVTRMLLELLK
ncbi:MAG: alpha/beta hydrolase [Alphaproteobacteria bacterium]|nr:alpha/beta hydrolase [Alphaproteobacteria bacterium]